MKISNKKIDGGKSFDWGRTSSDYAKYRDIYPQEFYDKIMQRGFGIPGQALLDLGTGTGVLPRNLASHGAKWVGVDQSPEQIQAAKLLSEGKNIEYIASAAEDLSFPNAFFDGITACPCFWYFDHKTLAPLLARLLKHGGRFLVLCMEWLPYDDPIAGASEELVLRYHPSWSGKGATMQPISIPSEYDAFFEQTYHEEFLLRVPFTRESWNERMKSCRGSGASLSQEQIDLWEKEHMDLLARIAPPAFEVLHYGAIAELTLR